MKTLFTDVLGKNRVADYPLIVKDLMEAFDTLDVNMNLKIHFLHHHLDAFGRQVSTESDKQGERFHQTCKPMETRYRGKKLQSMIADLC